MGSSDAPLDARLARHRELLSASALSLGLLGVLLVSSRAGWPAVSEAFGDVRLAWLAAIVALVPSALAGYTAAYRATVRIGGGPTLGRRTAARIVTAGFGAFAIAGGFRMDQRVLRSLGMPDAAARRLVLGLGALEYGVLAPIAWTAALALLASGRGADVQTALLWSWAMAVPVGFAIGLWSAAPRRRDRVDRESKPRSALRDALEAIGLLRCVGRHPVRHAAAWAGMTLCSAAVPVVVAYRVANFLLPAIPAIRSHVRLGPLPTGRRVGAR